MSLLALKKSGPILSKKDKPANKDDTIKSSTHQIGGGANTSLEPLVCICETTPVESVHFWIIQILACKYARLT
jgi:hypothetical protein